MHPDAGEQVADEVTLKAAAKDPLVVIGSHSQTHPNFKLLGDARARQELVRSRLDLERILGLAVKAFSFPHGAYNERSLSLAKQAGYERIFTIAPKPYVLETDGMVVGRVRVEPDDWPIEFALKARGAYRWMVSVSALKRRFRASPIKPAQHSSTSAQEL